MTVLDGQSQITNCMFEILAQEAQEEQGKIQIFMDPDFSRNFQMYFRRK